METKTSKSLAQARAKFNTQAERIARQVEALKEQTQAYATTQRARADWATVGTAQHLSESLAQAIKDIQSAMDRHDQVRGRARFCACGHAAVAWCEAKEAWECGDCHNDKCEFGK